MKPPGRRHVRVRKYRFNFTSIFVLDLLFEQLHKDPQETKLFFCFVFFSLFFPPHLDWLFRTFRRIFPPTVSFRIPLFCTGTTSRKHVKCAFDTGWLSSSSNKAKQQRKKKNQNGSEKPALLCGFQWVAFQWVAFQTANSTPKTWRSNIGHLNGTKQQQQQQNTPLNVKFLSDIQIQLLSLCRRFSNETLNNYLLTQSIKLSNYLPRRRNGWNEP